MLGISLGASFLFFGFWVFVQPSFIYFGREILNSRLRNTEDAEGPSKASEGSSVQSARGLRKGVWYD